MKYVGTFGSGFQTVIMDILEGSNIKIDNSLSVLKMVKRLMYTY